MEKNTPFDAYADSYDEAFTHSNIGKAQRDRVYHWLNKVGFFSKPKKVIEINCGTGFDAEQFHQKGHEVLATDASPGMIAYAKKHRDKAVTFKVHTFSEVSQGNMVANYDALFSNFGGLNCLDIQGVGTFFSEVVATQKSGDQLILVFMSKYCALESLYYLMKLNFSKVFRRNTKNGLDVNLNGELVKTYYHSPKEVIHLLRESYVIDLIKPVSFFLPPSYLEPFFKKRKRLLSVLNQLEVIFGRFSFMAKWSDHYILVASKK